jgi:hypothetical protein
MERVSVAGLQVDRVLYRFVVGAALPGSGVGEDRFWTLPAPLLEDRAEQNRALLAQRTELQARIDQWLLAARGQLAASRRGRPRLRNRHNVSCGGQGRRAVRGRSVLPPHGTGLRRVGLEAPCDPARDEEERLVGAVGVSGDTPDKDEQAAGAGLDAADLSAETG